MNITHLMPPRVLDLYKTGPVQRAELEEFAHNLLKQQRPALTADGYLVNPGDEVWVLDFAGAPTAAKVDSPEPKTNYNLFGPVPVAHSWLKYTNCSNYAKQL